MPLEVIGAGFGRTGTLSLQAALNTLLDGECYHMSRCMPAGDAPKWLAIEEAVRSGDTSSIPGHAERIFGSKYSATVDFPACTYFEELLAAYPDAKVVLSVRDSADAWYRSAADTIANDAVNNAVRRMGWIVPPLRRGYEMLMKCMWENPRTFKGEFKSRGREVYEEWNAHVRRTVPGDRLLVFNVKQGWAPLCEFLGKPVPEGPFPNVNDTADFKRSVRRVNVTFGAVVAAGVAAVAVAVTAIAKAAQAR